MKGVGRLVLAATVVGWSWPVAGAVLEPSQLLRITAVKEVSVNNEPMLSVTLERLDGGPGATYYVPDQPGPSGADAVDPPPPVAVQLKNAGIGAIVRVRIAAGEYGVTLVGIEPVPCLPGEDEPNAYVLVRTSTIGHEGGKHVLVHVTKFGRPSTFIVPYRTPQGELATAALANAMAGAVLDVRATDEQIAGHRVIRCLDEYRPTLIGRILGLSDDASGRPQVRVKVAEETVELAVPAADAAAPLLDRRVLASLVAGRTVRFTATGGKTPSLRSIELACSFGKAGRRGADEHVVSCGDVSFHAQAQPASPSRYRISPPSSERRSVPPGVALLAQPDLRHQLLLDAKQLESLEAAMLGPAIEIDAAAMGQAVGVVTAAADAEQRFEAEQKLFGLVQDYVARVEATQVEQDREVRKILTPDQYEVLKSSRPRRGMFIVGGQSSARVGGR
jgi:hypothetical protein